MFTSLKLEDSKPRTLSSSEKSKPFFEPASQVQDLGTAAANTPSNAAANYAIQKKQEREAIREFAARKAELKLHDAN